MDEDHSSMEGFSVEMVEFEVRKVKKFDRLVNITEGGSVDIRPLVYKGRVYFASMNRNVYCVDALSGELVWKFTAGDRIGVVSAPMVYNNTIYIGSYDHNMYALDADTGKLRWKFRTQAEILSVASEKDDIIYFTSRDHCAYAVRADSGELVWKFRAQDEMQSSPTVFEEKLLFCSYDHNVYCVEAVTGRLLWKCDVHGECLNAPYLTIHNRVVYVGSLDNNLYAIHVDTGKVKWKKKISNYGAMPTPAIHNGVIYEVGREGVLFAMDLGGNVLWKFRKNLILGHPLVHENRIYLTCEDKHLYCVGLDGKEVWKFRTEDAVWWMAAFYRDMVFFGSYDCNLYAIRKDTAQLVWKFRCPGSPSYQPPLHDEYEVALKIPEREVESEGRPRRYEFGLSEELEGGTTYKSRVTYRISSQYAAKGKYQRDADEEGL